MTRGTSRLLAIALGLSILSEASRLHGESILRSTFFDGNSYFTYEDHAALRPDGEMTIETWVKRSDGAACETIASRGFDEGSWDFGFCPDLRLVPAHRSTILATRTVPSGQWCHVAATIDEEGEIAYYIDGEPAGGGLVQPLDSSVGVLTIAADTDGSHAFSGWLDELRIWNHVRTPAQIRQGMYASLLDRSGLLAEFPAAGAEESVNGLVGTPMGSPEASQDGMMPRDLLVAEVPIPGGQTSGADSTPLRYHVSEMSDGLITIDVIGNYVSIVANDTARAQSGQSQPGIALYLDRDLEPVQSPQPDEIAILALVNAGTVTRLRGTGQGYVDCAQTGDCPGEELFSVAVDRDCENDLHGPCVEFRIDRSLLGDDPNRFRFALWHFGYGDPDEEPLEAFVPDLADIDQPSTWLDVEIVPQEDGDGDCTAPFRMPSLEHVARIDNLDGRPSSVNEVDCLPFPIPGPDASYVYTAPVEGRYRVVVRSVSEGRPDLALALTPCPVLPGSCTVGADDSGAGEIELVEIDLNAGDTIEILVDSRPDEDTVPPELSEIELRIDRLELWTPLLVDVEVGDPQEVSFASSLLEEVWSVDGTRLLGTAREDDLVALLESGHGVSVHRAPSLQAPVVAETLLSFDRAVFEHGDDVGLTLWPLGSSATGSREVWVLSKDTGDYEKVTLDATGGMWLGSVPLAASKDGGVPDDGELSAERGELLVAVAPDPATPRLARALVEAEDPDGLGLALEIDADLEPPVPTLPGRHPGESPRPVGVVEAEDGSRLLLASDQLIVSLRSVVPESRAATLDHWLDALGEVSPVVYVDHDAGPDAAAPLIRVDPLAADLQHGLQVLRALGLRGEVRASDERTLGLLAIWGAARLRGLSVELNRAGEFHGWPTTDGDGEDAFQQPHASDCLQGTHRAWMFAALTDRDERRVRVAVIDRNFCQPFSEEMRVAGVWRADRASDPWAIGANWSGGGRFHGTLMASVIGSRLDSGNDTAGSGGQVADLLLYNVDSLLYLHDVVAATDRAVIDGARVINMSFGFRCEGVLGSLCEGNPDCPTLEEVAAQFGMVGEPNLSALMRALSCSGDVLTRGEFHGSIRDAVNAGVVVVASVGNELVLPPASVIPAAFREVVTVGVTNPSYDARHNLLPVDAWVLETTRGLAAPPGATVCFPRELQSVSGASSGAAYTSGIVALLRAMNPGLGPVAIQSLLKATTARVPGSDPRVTRFLRSGDVVQRAGVQPIGDLPRSLAFFSPSFGLDESDGSTAALCGAGRMETGDTADRPIVIPFLEASSPSGWAIEDAAIHPFAIGPGNEQDHYVLEVPGDAPCRRYQVDLRLSTPRGTAATALRLAFRGDPSSGRLTTLPDILIRSYTIYDALLDPERPIAFEVVGDDSPYQLTVSVVERTLSTVSGDRFEPNETTAEAPVFDASHFRDVHERRQIIHRLTIPDLSFACAGDVDVFEIELPEAEEVCGVDLAGYCGPGVELALRDLTPRLHLFAAFAEITVLWSDGAEVARADTQLSVECPRQDGLSRLFVALRRESGLLRATNYRLQADYRLPKSAVILADLAQEAGTVICCEDEACSLPAPDRYPPGAVRLESFSPHDLEPRTMAFEAECPDATCEDEPSLFVLYDWPGGDAPLHIEIRFEEPPPESFSVVLLGGPGQPIGITLVDSDDPSHFEVLSDPRPEGSVFLRMRGLEPTALFDIANFDPLPPPPDSAGDLRLVRDVTACSELVKLHVLATVDDPLAAASAGVTWDARELELVDVSRGPDLRDDQVFGLFVNTRDSATGVATLGISLEETVDAAGGLRVVTLCFRRAAGASNGGTAVCLADDVGDPSVEAILSVEESPGRLVSRSLATLECVQVATAPDTTPPSLICPERIEAIADSQSANGDTRTIIWSIEASDECELVEVVCTPASGSEFPVGTTTVVCEAHDAAGNVTECSFDVVVRPQLDVFRRGDANADGVLDITDAVATLSFLFSGGVEPACPDAADTNDDGRVDITDPVGGLSYLFQGGRAPPDPGPLDCGPDPQGGLGDCVYECVQ